MEEIKEWLLTFWYWLLEFIDGKIYKYNEFKNTIHSIHGGDLINSYALYFIGGMAAGIGLALIILWIGRRS